LSSLSVKITTRLDPTDLLGVDVSGSVALSDGLAQGSKISIDGIEIGSVVDVENNYLEFSFNENATVDRVQTLVRELTYSNTAGAIDRSLNIDITTKDVGGRGSQAHVTIVPQVPQGTPGN